MPRKSHFKKLLLLPKEEYIGVEKADPIRFYFWPLIGKLYRRRVELCLDECTGGTRVLDVGFGSGVNFLNLHELYKEIHGLDLTARAAQIADKFQKLGIHTDLRKGNVLKMPYPDEYFDTVLLVSILEHIKPDEQLTAFREMRRVLKPGGQVVYGVPVEQPLMVLAFRLLGYNIRQHHFSSALDIGKVAQSVMGKVRQVYMKSPLPFHRPVYQVGHFIKL